jgi:hypothetical protein
LAGGTECVAGQGRRWEQSYKLVISCACKQEGRTGAADTSRGLQVWCDRKRLAISCRIAAAVQTHASYSCHMHSLMIIDDRIHTPKANVCQCPTKRKGSTQGFARSCCEHAGAQGSASAARRRTAVALREMTVLTLRGTTEAIIHSASCIQPRHIATHHPMRTAGAALHELSLRVQRHRHRVELDAKPLGIRREQLALGERLLGAVATVGRQDQAVARNRHAPRRRHARAQR